MLERCLYALEMAWHPWFNPATANCRLPFAQEQNRPLFTALFKHMQARAANLPPLLHQSARCNVREHKMEDCKFLLKGACACA